MYSALADVFKKWVGGEIDTAFAVCAQGHSEGNPRKTGAVITGRDGVQETMREEGFHYMTFHSLEF